MRILVANQHNDFMKRIGEQLSGTCEIKFTSNGHKVLDLCCTYKPDLLVLDLELPHLDGLSILRAISSCGQKIDVLAITVCSESEYVLRQLAQLGVHYILPKPCTAAAAVSRIYEMMQMNRGDNWSLEDEANSLLLSLGMRMNLSGYTCIREAIMMLLKDDSLQLTKSVYPAIAEKIGRTPQCVERVIRSAVNDAWNRRNERLWNMYFKPDRSGEISCPTNGYFISRMCMSIARRKIS